MRTPLLVCASMLLLAISALATAADQGVTARQGLAAATAAAQKWQPDAVLTSVSTMRAAPDGRAANWDYMFHSPKSGKACTFTVAGDQLVEQLEVRPHMTDRIITNFVDSTDAATAAKSNGLDTKGQPLVMSLLVMGQATKGAGTFWSVSGGYAKGALAVVVDAKTGKLAYKQEMP
ncbi:MAG TPA: hypothetical protein VH814_22975 [Steroidobacteraceae bacterium]|jgi:hypothetical protein